MFGHPMILGQTLCCLANVLEQELLSAFLEGMSGVRGEPRQGRSPSGSSARETVRSGSRWQAPGCGEPYPKVFCRHPPEQLVPGGRQMVLDPPSVAV